jgi:uncharacterized SAM-binding protein YcdF (DUF218 family)
VIIDFVKERLHLTSPLTFFIVFSVAVLLLYARPSSRLARRCALALLIGFWFVTTSLGATLLAAPLSRGLGQLQARSEANGADAVVLLGGGAATFTAAGRTIGVLTPNSILRALEAARVSEVIGARVVIASAGIPRPDLQTKPESEMLRDALLRLGVPAAKIVEESGSRTTREQVRLIPAVLRVHGVQRFVLVTSPTHMRRAVALFRAAGVEPVPSVSLVRSEQIEPPSWVIPTEDSLSRSSEAVYEYAAWVYYWWNGWLKPSPVEGARAPMVSVSAVNPGPPAATYPRLAPSFDVLTQKAYRLPRFR